MIRAILILILSLSVLSAQAPPEPATIPIILTVNFPPPQLVAAKYGPLPKWAMFGEVVGCNQGSRNLTYGEGDVIYLIRANTNLQAFSIQDARSLVANSQSASKWNITKAWINAGADSVLQSKAAGLIGGGNATGVGIVVGAEATKIFLPNAAGALSLKQVIQYSIDGLQPTMQLHAGRCSVPYSVLFATPGPSPAVTTNHPLTVRADVPADR
jgi:hypothetical protein